MTDARDVPILILGYNRADRLREVVDALRPSQPRQIFLAIDGPRQHDDADQAKVRATQEVMHSIDWQAQVRSNFQTTNLGCGRGVSTGISWFFEHVDEGIILEDDVVPGSDFLTFCAELLERYRDDERIFSISGCNFAPLEAVSQSLASYRFSAITHVWGWATWRRSWDLYRFSMEDWRSRLRGKRRWNAMGANVPGYVYWTAVFDWMRFGHIDTWDYQLSLAQMVTGGLTATSNTNLTENIGFSGESTHTNYTPPYVRPAEALSWPLTHPTVERDLAADRWVRRSILQSTTSSMLGMARHNLLQRAATASQPMRRLGQRS